MAKKFNKNRSVDSRYLNVPIKYVLNYKGANIGSADKYEDESYEEWRRGMLDKWDDIINESEVSREVFEKIKKRGQEEGISFLRRKLVKKGKDKTLCIVDFYGKNALVAWRNHETRKVGMTRLCPVLQKNGKAYLQYKDKLILISNALGWVF